MPKIELFFRSCTFRKRLFTFYSEHLYENTEIQGKMKMKKLIGDNKYILDIFLPFYYVIVALL